MKAKYTILAALLLVISACSSAYRSTSTYDDVYYDGSESYLEEIEENNSYTPVREREQTMTNKYESEQGYGEMQEEGQYDEYREESGNGNTYITNNYYGDYYDEPYDYFYSSRIRRFSRPYMGFSYFDGCYTDYRWYDPYYTGVSIYFRWGSPSWYRYYPSYYPYYRYQAYNPWCNDPWYNPYAGSYYSGFNHGYWTGFHDGYYTGRFGNWYGYGNNFYSGNYGYNDSYTPTDYYYGPRFASNTGNNTGMRGQRSEVKYGKNGSNGNGGQRNNVKAEELGSQTITGSGKRPAATIGGQKSNGTQGVRKDYFEKKESNGQNVGGNKDLNNGIRTVRSGRPDKPEVTGSGRTEKTGSSKYGLNDQKGNISSGNRKTRSDNRNRQYEWDRYRGRQENVTNKSRGENLHNDKSGVIRYRENPRNGENRNSTRNSIFKREERSRSPQENNRYQSLPERRERTNPAPKPERKEIRRSTPAPNRNTYSSPQRKSEPVRSEPRRTIKRESPSPRSSSTPNYNSGSNSGSRSRSSSPSYFSPSRSSRSSGSRNNSSQRLRTPR